MFAGVERERFYFVHSYAARGWPVAAVEAPASRALTWAEHGEPFVAAVENGPLSRDPVPPGEVRRGRRAVARATGCGRCRHEQGPRPPAGRARTSGSRTSRARLQRRRARVERRQRPAAALSLPWHLDCAHRRRWRHQESLLARRRRAQNGGDPLPDPRRRSSIVWLLTVTGGCAPPPRCSPCIATPVLVTVALDRRS